MPDRAQHGARRSANFLTPNRPRLTSSGSSSLSLAGLTSTLTFSSKRRRLRDSSRGQSFEIRDVRDQGQSRARSRLGSTSSSLSSSLASSTSNLTSSLTSSLRSLNANIMGIVNWDGDRESTQITVNLDEIAESFPDLTFEERKMLLSIRQRKFELLQELSQLKDELGDVNAEIEATDSEEGAKIKNLQMGKKKFNMDPKKGIAFLISHSLITETAEDIAQFLYQGEGLNKTMIGDYLGEKSDFNEAVLKAFVELHDFTDLILVQALRQFLWSFRLPGEAQKIDRMMESFAQRYCNLNPDIFTNSDTCYVLSFAIIMLNTSLHNPSVRDKPSIEQFVSMNRGINDGGDLPRTLLESLFDSIKTEPFKIPEDDGNDLMHTFFNPDREGWLWKQGGRYKSWKRRWFILNDNCLYYFEFTTDKEPRGIIPLENIRVREASDRGKQHCFELFSAGNDVIKACKTDSEGKVVEGKHTVYRMSASTEEEKDEWLKCIQRSISHNPFYDMLAARKKKVTKNSP